MATLEDVITALKIEIDGYVAQANASTTSEPRKDLLLRNINSARETLNRLLDDKKAQSGGNNQINALLATPSTVASGLDVITTELGKRVTLLVDECFAKRQKLIEEDAAPKGPITRSEWVKILTSESKIAFNSTLIEALAPPALTDYVPLPGPEYYSVTKRGEEPRDAAVMGTRELFGKVLEKWKIPGRFEDINSRNIQTLATHKPDHLQRLAGRAGEHSIIVVGELKGMLDSLIAHGDFNDEQIGQILDFLQVALVLQPWRQFIYGFLSDTRRFQFFRAFRDPARGIVFERSIVYSDAAGWIALQTLLTQSEEVLGFKDVSVPGWTFGPWLGSGATSVVFSVTSETDGVPAVCKLYTSDTEGNEQRAREARALKVLADQSQVPKLIPDAPISTRCGLSVLIKTPLGLPIPAQMRLPVSAYAPLVTVLETAHKGNIFHNDVAPSNIFAVQSLTGEYQTLLNDFGSSKTREELEVSDRVGTRVLFYDTSGAQPFGAAADLKALVRSVFYLTQATFSFERVKHSSDLDALIAKQLPVFIRALSLASDVNYDELRLVLGR